MKTRLMVWLVMMGSVAQAAQLIYTDEPYRRDNNPYCYAIQDPVGASDDDWCLRMHIKNGHHYRPTYAIPAERQFFNAPGWSLVFRIRSDRLIRSDYPLQGVLSWADKAHTFSVMDHLYADEAGEEPVRSIAREYVYCRIELPSSLEKFRTFRLMYDVSLGKVEEAVFYVDDLKAVHDQGLLIESAEVLGPRHVMLTCLQQADFDSARDVNVHVLRDEQGKRLAVEKVGLRSWVTGFVEGTPVAKFYVYLQLADALVPGMRYRYESRMLNEAGIPPQAGALLFAYSDTAEVSSSIKVNQVGYLPDGPKWGYVGNYLGDLGEMPVSAREVFLCRADGTRLQRFALVRRPEKDLFMAAGVEKPFCGEEVWSVDFSAWKEPGRYVLQVPGMGRSYPFEISDAVFNTAYYHTARVFYYQRSGAEIEERFGGKWHRPISHTEPALYHNSVRDMSRKLYDPSIEPGIGEPIDLSGGWYDAADYNKYTRSAADAANCILSIYELAPERFVCDALNIPESGNGVPDILDQVKWELDWLAKMVSANGGVFNKCSFPDFAFKMPQERTKKMWAITKTTRDTAYACAVLAKAARIFRAHEVFPGAADEYERKARLAWGCLERNPTSYPVPEGHVSLSALQHPLGDGDQIPAIRTGPYYQEFDDRVARAWAALEMALMSGNAADLQRFYTLVDARSDESLMVDLENLMVDQWWHGASNPMRFYPIMKQDRFMAQAVARGMRRVAAAYQNGYDTWRYKISMKSSLTSANFGGYSMSTRWTVYYILFYEVLGEASFLELAQRNLDTQLGANPLSFCYITGLGSASPQYPHCKLSEYDGIQEPIPGFSIYGVAHSLPGKGWYLQIMENAYPAYQGSEAAIAYYPTTRKYVDAWEPVKMGEYVVDNLARTAMCFGYFSNPSKPYAPKEELDADEKYGKCGLTSEAGSLLSTPSFLRN